MQNIKAGLSVGQGVAAYQLDQARAGTDKATNTLIGVNLAYGSSSAESSSTTRQRTQQASTLSAGNHLSLTATASDITLKGSELRAGQDMRLVAPRDITLHSTQNTQTVEGSNQSRGSSVGVGITVGTGSGVGVNANASISRGKGFEQGDSTYATASVLTMWAIT